MVAVAIYTELGDVTVKIVVSGFHVLFL